MGGVVNFQHVTSSHENGRFTRVVKRAFPSTVFHPSDRNIVPGPQQIPIPFCGCSIMPKRVDDVLYGFWLVS